MLPLSNQVFNIYYMVLILLNLYYFHIEQVILLIKYYITITIRKTMKILNNSIPILVIKF